MKKVFLVLLLGAMGLKANAQEIVSYNLQDFRSISLSGKMNVLLVAGEENSFEVTLHNTTGDRVHWDVTNEQLNLRLRANNQLIGAADVKIVYKMLDHLAVSQAAVHTENPISSAIFSVSAQNGANVTLDMVAKDITVTTAGNSAVTLSGETLYLTMDAGVKSKIDARALQARSAIITARMNAEVFVWGTEKLDARANANSVIFYKGSPMIFLTTTGPASSVEQFSY